MSGKDTARLLCAMAIVFGVYLQQTRPNDGPANSMYRIGLVVGGIVGILFLGFPSGGKTQTQQDAAREPDAGDANAQLQRPTWMGDPRANFRRMMVAILIVGALVGGFAYFIMTARP